MLHYVYYIGMVKFKSASLGRQEMLMPKVLCQPTSLSNVLIIVPFY